MWQRVILVGLLVATPLVGAVVGLAIAQLLQKPENHTALQETTPFLGQGLGQGTVQTAAVAALSAPLGESAAQSPPKIAPPSPPPVVTPPKRAGLLDLQPFYTSQSVSGRNGVSYRLVQPNPYVNSWLLLQQSGEEPVSLHLENPFPAEQRIELAAEGLTIRQGARQTMCRWADGGMFAPARAALTPVCDGRLWLRTARRGFRTQQDAVVEALRGLGDFGEGIINLYKTEIQQDALAETVSWQVAAQAAITHANESLPLPALMQPNTESVPVQRDRLGIDLAGVENRAPLALGRWYLAANHPGVAVSMAIPGRIAADILASYHERVAPLEMPEATALVYMLAFDLDRHELKYRLGADHPAVGWSRRAKGAQDESGPDGFATISPFVRVAMVNPYDLSRLAATLPGGFKREHGAFKYGALARSNQGNHYGFMEEGVILSRLHSGLASIVGRLDGGVELKSWDGFDEQRLRNLRFVRQNGVPLIEAAENGRPGIPGRLVNRWGDGNWSGALSVAVGDDGNPRRGGALRSLRSGVCVQTAAKGKRWLIYGWFTAATPSAMARTFQAYRCDYALHLDMNSADLTYTALYRKDGGRLQPEYLNQTMADAEAGQDQLRYVTTNDSRDFFIVLQKKP